MDDTVNFKIRQEQIIDDFLAAGASNDKLNAVADATNLKDLETILNPCYDEDGILLPPFSQELPIYPNPEILEELPLFYNHVLISKDTIHDESKKNYCDEHLLPWCKNSKQPSYFCNCNLCQKLPDKYINNDNAQCTECLMMDSP